MPGSRTRLAIHFVKTSHQVVDLLHDLPRRFSLAQQMDQRPSIGGRIGQKEPDRFGSQSLVVQFFDNLPTGRQPEFQAKGAGQLNEESIERSYAQSVQI